MAQSRRTPGKSLRDRIPAYVRAGGYPEVAAVAAGMPREVFTDWMQRGLQSRSPTRYRAFARSIFQAEAQARLGAETIIRRERPLDWLKHGPGKERPGQPGWTALIRGGITDLATSHLLQSPMVQAFLAHLLDCLLPHPDARDSLLRHLDLEERSRPSSPRSRKPS